MILSWIVDIFNMFILLTMFALDGPQIKDPLFLIDQTRFSSYLSFLYQINCPMIFWKCFINKIETIWTK